MKRTNKPQPKEEQGNAELKRDYEEKEEKANG